MDTHSNVLAHTKKISVWDPLIRIFHWTLVISFFTAYFTEDDFQTIHTWAGYTIISLLLVRILWGFIGTKHAKFSDFIYSKQQIINFIKDTINLKAKRYIGHNPAGGAMIFLLLLSLIMTISTGLFLFAISEGQGPLAPLIANNWSDFEDTFEELHEFFANFTLFLIFVHVVGVVIESFIHKENLIRSMINGKKLAEQNKDHNND
ncbi:MAG: cytochrome b/b6 domain-containing protein [Alteromonadaceae bacterium]|nr:cytochrome b/b6 domain-containing protein [Alteromonadaceae bacterium]